MPVYVSAPVSAQYEWSCCVRVSVRVNASVRGRVSDSVGVPLVLVVMIM